MEQGNAKLVIPFETSRTAGAGAVAAYLMRRIAARAGAYAPGIQEHLFFQIGRRPIGASLDSLAGWMQAQGGTLTGLGYYILQRRMPAPTADVSAWVEAGEGFRAAVLSVDGRRLHKGGAGDQGAAVGLTVYDDTCGIAEDKRPEDVAPAGLVMFDPWPTFTPFVTPPPSLERAHLANKFAALLLYWSGHA